MDEIQNHQLSFSIIVNTTDRAEPLRTLLRGLEQQSYPHFEVIAVVGPTRDHTLAVLAEYGERVRVLRCPAANLGQSRNIGLLAARGELVAYVDDDAVPCRNWLAQLAELFVDPAVAGTGGIVYQVHPHQPVIQHRVGISSALAEQQNVCASWLGQTTPPGSSRQWVARMMGTNMAFRRAALLAIGGFDEFYEWVYDDTDIAMRLHNAGQIVHPVYEAAVYHVPSSSRNRVAQSYTGRWWIVTKAGIYFTLKNGPLAGENRNALVRRVLHLVHGHWLWAGELWRAGRISFGWMWYMRYQEVRSALQGFVAGGWRPRPLLSVVQLSAAQTLGANAAAIILPFPNAASAQQPAVDPVSGQQAQLAERVAGQITMPDAPLRICLLSSGYPPTQYEGVGRHTNLMARGLFALGHTVHVITRGEREQVSFYDGAYVHTLPPARARYLHYRHLPNLFHSLNHSHAVYDKVQRLLLNDGVQAVDSPVWQVDGLVTALAGLLPVVVRPQTALRQVAQLQKMVNDDVRLVGELEEQLIARASFLAPNSQATVKALQEVYRAQLTPDRYQVIPHGIEPVPDEQVRPFPLAQPPTTLTVLYVGRLEKRKGIAELLAAMPQVLSRLPTVRFVLAGADNSRSDGFLGQQGMDYPTFFAQRHEKFAANVEFLGAVSEERLQQLYQSCHLFVAPSLYESFGLIYLEAMNYAKPVIGCRAGGIPEVVEDGVTGVLVEPGSVGELATALIRLLQQPQSLYELGLAGRQRLLDHFTHVQMARSFVEIYRRVVGL